MSRKYFCMASSCPLAPKRCKSFLKDLNQEFKDPDEKAKLMLHSSCQSTSLGIYKETSRKCTAENVGLLGSPDERNPNTVGRIESYTVLVTFEPDVDG